MMIKGGIRIGGLGISGFDSDAAAYFERAGVTDATAKNQINAFVKGMKGLGLYNNMVSWPLRSAQNAGTGTTAYSLGGLGTFNGTLVNGPTWNADFVDFATINTRMTTAISVAASPVAAMFVGNAEVDAGDNAGGFLTAGINVSGRQFQLINSGDPNSQNYFGYKDLWPPSAQAFSAIGFASGSGTRTSRQYTAFRVLSSTAARVSRNAAQSASDLTVTGWDTSSPASVQFGFYPSNASQYRLSFMAYFTSAVDNAADAALFSLYKTTLGTGLGLP
jgi:hypothetical protein